MVPQVAPRINQFRKGPGNVKLPLYPPRNPSARAATLHLLSLRRRRSQVGIMYDLAVFL